MKIVVEVSQMRRIKEGQWEPALVGLIIDQPTGAKGPNKGMSPDISIFVDLTARQARNLAKDLNRHAERIEAVVLEHGEVEHG